MAADPNLLKKRPTKVVVASATASNIIVQADAVALDPSGTVSTLAFTDGYVDPTRARFALIRAKFLLAGCCAYDDPQNKNYPRLDVTFQYPISTERAAEAVRVLSPLALPVSPSSDVAEESETETSLVWDGSALKAAEVKPEPPAPRMKPSEIRAAEMAAKASGAETVRALDNPPSEKEVSP